MDNPILTPIHVLKARQLQAVNLICLLLTFIIQRRPTNTKLVKLPTRKVILERIVVREELMCNLLNGGQCRDLIRMSENAFMRLCDILKGEGGLRPMQRMSIDEHVARFFHIVGLEGIASHSRIIKNVFTREDKLLIPSGRYCLVDAGLPHTSKLMAPYRGVRYHLKEYSMRAPHNSKELFNLCHVSLHNTIERAFGVLKRMFPIIQSTTEPFYSCETQSAIFFACCILHNFLLDEDRDINLEDEVMQEILNGPQDQEHRNSTEIDEGSSIAEQLTNSIANETWVNYLTHSNN
ncbi:uncharacterized protein LOC111880503 [Lactuca sativa]|uniref:uncharacterized protein LOC111880503 n=1 Tax=Lactuca sativa TaxID=4236 RepID=UPI000CD81E9D|nr:uncharacterized protein LOC111880503 [Lactuca sativa]